MYNYVSCTLGRIQHTSCTLNCLNNTNTMCSHLLALLIILCYSFSISICQLSVDDPCITSELHMKKLGTCMRAKDCWHIREDLKNGITPTICGFVGKESIVCCRQPLDVSNSVRFGETMKTDCGPVPEGASNVERTGQKAWDKCIDNLEYLYPCKNSTQNDKCEYGNACLSTKRTRTYSCGHKRVQPRSSIPLSLQYVGGSRNAKDREFPHMALLGYGMSAETTSWSCSGTVVSESYVLTAGHCSMYSQYGLVSFIRVGLLQPSDPIDPSRLHRVDKIVLHPDIRPDDTFAVNDLALIKTDKPMILDERVFPACLHTGYDIKEDQMLATGWGLKEGTSKQLQKIYLYSKDPTMCSHYVTSANPRQTYLLKPSQLCFGERVQLMDPCEMDAGGPIQVFNDAVDCTYVMVGVRSFPRECGNHGKPAIYTRVSHFIPWIEQVVWP